MRPCQHIWRGGQRLLTLNAAFSKQSKLSWSAGSGSTMVVPRRSLPFHESTLSNSDFNLLLSFSSLIIMCCLTILSAMCFVMFHIFLVCSWPKVLVPRLPVDVSTMHFSDMEKLNIHAMQLGERGTQLAFKG